MAKSAIEKIGIRPGSRILCIHAPEIFIAKIHAIGHPTFTRLSGHFDYIHLFVITQFELKKRFKTLKVHLNPGGMLWISWPKSKQLDTDLTLPKVIEIGYDVGMVESKTISIDTTWSAIKFTFPVKGKHYHNSYGKLK